MMPARIISRASSTLCSKTWQAATATCAAWVHSLFGSVPVRQRSRKLFRTESETTKEYLSSTPFSIVFSLIFIVFNTNRLILLRIVSKDQGAPFYGRTGSENVELPDGSRARDLGRTRQAPSPHGPGGRRAGAKTRSGRHHCGLCRADRSGKARISADRLCVGDHRRPAKAFRVPASGRKRAADRGVPSRRRRRRLSAQDTLPRYARP